MKQYQYKIQWLFPVISGFVTQKEDLLKELFSVIKILGARSLSQVVFRDIDMKIVSNYTNMVCYPSGVASIETIKYIKKELKKNENIMYVELLRN